MGSNPTPATNLNMKLRDQQFSPPGGWRYEEPSTGARFSALIKGDLVKQVRKHRDQKGIPAGNVEDDIETWVCAQLPPEMCVRETQGSVPVTNPSAGIGLQEVIQFLNSITHVFRNNGLVDQSVAEERANICLSCPLNTTVSGCRPCAGVATLVYKVLGAKRVSSQDKLKECGVCGCALAAKVWVPKSYLESLKSVQSHRDKYPDYCWMNK